MWHRRMGCEKSTYCVWGIRESQGLVIHALSIGVLAFPSLTVPIWGHLELPLPPTALGQEGGDLEKSHINIPQSQEKDLKETDIRCHWGSKEVGERQG